MGDFIIIYGNYFSLLLSPNLVQSKRKNCVDSNPRQGFFGISLIWCGHNRLFKNLNIRFFSNLDFDFYFERKSIFSITNENDVK